MQQQSINIWLVAMYGDYAPNYCTVTRWWLLWPQNLSAITIAN